MKRAVGWTLVLSLGAFACGEASRFGTVEGRVLLRGANPQAGVPVQADGPQPERTITDDQGRYAFAQLRPGRYLLQAKLGLFSRESQVQIGVEVEGGAVTPAPDLVFTPAGEILGQIETDDPAGASGFRVQLLGTTLQAVADAQGAFVVRRVPRGVYELVAERADIGGVRRAGIEVVPFATTDVGILQVGAGGFGVVNRHPRFLSSKIALEHNRTPDKAHVRPLPYKPGEGRVRRFDQVALSADATDDDGDPLSYTWSASAGRLFDALSPNARWQPDAYAGHAATLTVTVRDGYGGVASLSTEVEIADVVSGSAHRNGDVIVYSYRVNGAAWRVAKVDWTSFEASELFVVDGNDPQPLSVSSGVVYQCGAELCFFDTVTGTHRALGVQPRPAQPSQPTVGAADDALLVIPSTNFQQLLHVDPRSGQSETLLTCDGSCRALKTQNAAFVVHDLGGAGRSTFFLGTLSQTVVAQTVSTPVGRGLAVDGPRAVYVDGRSGRGARNRVAVVAYETSPITVYEGLYDTIVWALDRDSVFISEQSYRALRHPPYIRRVVGQEPSGIFPPEDDDDWMADRLYAAWGGLALIRRLAAADWPEPFDEARSELVLVDSAEAFR